METPSFYQSANKDFTLIHGDCVEVMEQLKCKFDMIFADPPYFLSNGGISVQSGKVVSVDKGDWDKGDTSWEVDVFNYRWLQACWEKLRDKGTIWISGTHHNIFSVARQLMELEFKILNVVTWVKTNPPPNISCRYFTYSTEFVIWARKFATVSHYFNYDLMKRINGGRQMTDVWCLPAIAPWEKKFGKHPTQKPLALLTRIILAATQEGECVLDPFAGSSTTGIATSLWGRKFVGIDRERAFLEISKQRREELEEEGRRELYRRKIQDVTTRRIIY